MKKNIYLILITFLSLSAYSQAGMNDSTFNTIDVGNSDGPNDYVACAVQQSDGKLIIGGGFTTYNSIQVNHIARLNIDGSLDTTFNVGTGANNTVKTIVIQSDGKILIGGSFTTYNDLIAQHITRLNSDGTRDISFVSGPGTTDNDINTILIQSSGKIVIGGSFTQYLGFGRVRFAILNTDGSVDNNLVVGINNEIFAMVMQSDGKIIIGGSFTLVGSTTRNKIARINPNGTLDTTFDPGTGPNNNVYALAILQLSPTSSYVYVGGNFTSYGGTIANRIVRLQSQGTIDTSFNSGGTGILPDSSTNINNCAVFSIAFQPSDQKLILGGSFSSYNGTNSKGVIRVNFDGSKVLVPGGAVSTEFIFTQNEFLYNDTSGSAFESVKSILVQSDGKVVIGGRFNNNNAFRKYINRVTTTGAIDTFNLSGGATLNSNGVKSMAIQADGKIIIVGYFEYYNGVPANRIARINTDGSLDTSFNTSSLNFANYEYITSVAIQNDGKILICGSFKKVLRLNSDGSKDTSFNPILTQSGQESGAWTIKLQTDGKILIGGGGSFQYVNGIARQNIARLNSDGTLDNTFNPGTGLVGSIWDIAIQDNGFIILVGAITNYNGTSTGNTVCISSTGGLIQSSSFPNGFSGARINTVAIQKNQKHIMGGSNGSVPNNICRILQNGANNLDNTFMVGSGANQDINKIIVQCDDKILIAGSFTTFNGVARNGFARLNADGSLDTTFDPGNGANSINTMALQNDGKIVIGGTFTSYNNIARTRVARVLNDIVNVYPAQTIGNILGSNSVCKGSSQTYTVPAIANADSYVWTLPTGASIVTNNGNSIVVSFDAANAASGNITVKGVNVCGSSNTATLPITVYSPIANTLAITGTTSVCVGTSFTYTVPLDTNIASYQWTLPTGASGTSSTNSITVSFGSSAVSGNITVQPSNVCGNGAITILPIVVNLTPDNAGTILGDLVVCRNQNVTYTVPVIANATSYIWTFNQTLGLTPPNTQTTSGSSSTSTTTSNSITLLIPFNLKNGTITVKGINACGIIGVSSSISINPNIIPTPSVSSPQTFCSINNPTINDLQVTGTNIKWYIDQITTSNPLNSSTLLVNGQTYYATQTVNGCESNRFNFYYSGGISTVNVDLQASPYPPYTNGITPFYCGATISDLGIKVVAAGNQNGLGETTPFCYDVPSGGIPLNTSTLLTNGTTYYLSQNLNSLCESIRVPLTISVITTPSPTGNISQNFTQGQTLSNLQVTGTNLIWYANQSDATNHVNPIVNTTLLVNGATYYVTQTNNGCESSPLAITVTAALGLNDYSKSEIKLYPNPTLSILHLSTNDGICLDKITIVDITGKEVLEQTQNLSSINVEKLAKGVYLLTAYAGEKKYQEKFIKE